MRDWRSKNFPLSQLTSWRKFSGHRKRRGNPGRILNTPWIHSMELGACRGQGSQHSQLRVLEKRDLHKSKDSRNLSSFTQVFSWVLYVRKLLETREICIDIMWRTIISLWGYHSFLNFSQRPVMLLIYSSGWRVECQAHHLAFLAVTAIDQGCLWEFSQYEVNWY